VSGQPLLTHGAEKAQGATAATLTSGPHLAPDEDKKRNTNTQRSRPKEDAHVDELKDMLLFNSAQALSTSF
jgi:hypothetical protein